MLIELVGSLRRQLRRDDLIARLGGDEFVIVFTGTSAPVAAGIVERLRPELPVPCSVGVVEWPAGSALDAALDSADALMYAQKRASRRPLARAE